MVLGWVGTNYSGGLRAALEIFAFTGCGLGYVCTYGYQHSIIIFAVGKSGRSFDQGMGFTWDRIG